MMNKYLVLFLSILSCLHAQKETGGTNAPDGKYQYQAALLVQHKFICGASIINENWLLTAAHCISIVKNESNVIILVGTTDLTNGTVYKVDKFIMHKKYDVPFSHAHDIALIYVKDKIIFNDKVQPIKLPKNRKNNYENRKAILAGWGTNTNNSIPSSKLQHVRLRVINLVNCAKYWKEKRNRIILKTQLCTSGSKEPNLVTHGDSGGALVIHNVQIGILSFAWNDLPDVFTRITSYLRWIKKHTS